jgi:uncharacterized glyoxalase superfamily protein PhnB
MDRAAAFYTGVLGFAVRWREPADGGGESCMLESGNARVLLSTGSHLELPPRFTGTLYFDMGGVREFWERVRGACDVVWPLEEMDYGSLEFGVRDPDGYVLAFSEAR